MSATTESVIRSPGHETCHHVTYLMSCEQFEQLLARAGGRCEMCGIAAEETPRGKLDIDHNGRLGYTAVRGLLCPNCNIHVMLIENGRCAMDDRTATYLSHPWHVLSGSHRPEVGTRTVTRRVRVDDELWADFGATCAVKGVDRSAYLREVMRWAIHDPDGKRPIAPKRPAEPTPKTPKADDE